MRSPLWVPLAGALLVALAGPSCSGGNPDSIFHGSSGGGSSGVFHGGGGDDAGCGLLGCSSGSGGGGSSGGGPCQGLECTAADCASQGKPETTLTGTVYDPAGNLPLYNIYVYVPNGTPAPIPLGVGTDCTPCEAPASGQPILGVSTGADGKFSLAKGANDPWGVPVGDNGGKGIPLVIQVGKWRKQLTIPSVTACATNDLDAIFNKGAGKARQLRLPANGGEGDMPLMAFTSGCDPAECFLRHIGIDDAEFAPPGTAGKHVHFYTGLDAQTGPNGSSVAGGNTPTQTYQWWGDSTKLLQYDIVFNACECNPNERGAAAYGAIDTYLKKGGRLFTTHYYGNWFVPQTGTADLQSVALWASVMKPGQAVGSGTANGWAANGANSEADAIDQSFPKGQAYAQWLQNNGISTSLGNITLADLRDDIVAPKPAGCSASQSCLSTRWIYNPGDQHPRYLSFNAPVGNTPDKQCGRAVYSDVHLSGASNDQTFPAECNDPNIDQPPGHDVNEKALEFLFFDLSSCVQNDTQPPTQPPSLQ